MTAAPSADRSAYLVRVVRVRGQVRVKVRLRLRLRRTRRCPRRGSARHTWGDMGRCTEIQGRDERCEAHSKMPSSRKREACGVYGSNLAARACPCIDLFMYVHNICVEAKNI